jgi:hypothetical protein
MTRRTLLELASRAAALPGSGVFLSAWMKAGQAHTHASSTPPEPDLFKSYKPKFFDNEDFKALEAFTELLIPTDETPGAREAHCACFIDFVLAASTGYAPETQKGWRKAMSTLNAAGFHGAGPAGRAKVLAEISRPERDGSRGGAEFEAYLLIKQENAFAFYTSREGIIDSLDYRGNSYNESFPACTHPEHHVV